MPAKIYNIDDTGHSTVQTPSKVLSTKGKRQVGVTTSAGVGKRQQVSIVTRALGITWRPCSCSGESESETPRRRTLLLEQSLPAPTQV